MLTGGCYCGKVRYEVDGQPFHPTVCHCVDCRKVAGAPAVAWFTVPSASLRFTAGVPRTFASSAWATRRFCPDCGTPLTFQRNDLSSEVDITTCSLDDPTRVPPADHTRTSSRLPWMAIPAGVKTYPEDRSDG